MTDLLVRLYDLPEFEAEAKVKAAGIVVRRALAPERQIVLDWVAAHFSAGWRSECVVAFGHLPVTIWIAVKDGEMLGFACHDATAKGFFGPTGVDEAARGQGIGEALLIATLKGMREAGYAYAVIGGVGPIAFYRRRLEVFEIPGSTPGIYGGMLRQKPKSE
ncbi:MAG TPA: GNAT family N-acetyltransferase [Arsenicitalea sp.]|jgi:GNAT superfamily N-acetyltransferase|nr:GNAT family N-acetyltransferase [Arsenicitalea sp.]